ncbi:hypothetical protein AtNW77_Chr3g0159021 [Arabidopsis thaliana]|uniref:Transmembrane protein n=2 Tax=Arabidopsis TaxID=3701 RepID=A0A178VFG3_ARATH|nr:hypothetical protein ISN45_At03g003820 [Arabidopsis thaliana x Arabidopsis arenosa]KAG7623973.1 hypothetical protein ISN45_At03g003820 [Arabidopsis thaliana x Arabidopsis arenosa]OAP04556.1 hypothetical protein AXX17_AT3G03730 [Arabidopsis thaliana]
MANLLYLQLSSCVVRGRFCSLNCDFDLCPNIVSRGSFDCRASRGPSWEEELFRDEGFAPFEFGNRKKKRPWWLDDDDDDDDNDDWMNEEEEDWSMVFEVFRTLSWMLAPIGISLLLGTDSNAGVMALAVPLVQSVLSLVVSKVWSRPSIRSMKRSRRDTFSRSASVSSGRTRKARQGGNMRGGVDKGGYKSWIVGDDDSNSMGTGYGGWDDLDTLREIRNDNLLNENVRPKQQFERKATRRWRVKEKPLLLRMLIAAFPFLGSWTKLLF